MEPEFLLYNNSKEERRVVNFVKKATSNILKAESFLKILKNRKIQNFSFSIILEDKKTTRRLNREWRGKNKIPDILSFSLLEKDLSKTILGDIFLTPEKIIKESKEGLLMVFQKLIIHGLLHLLGYDHEKEKNYLEMSKEETKILKELINN